MNNIVIKATNVEKQYLNNINFTMDNINFSIKEKDAIGLIGLNGAGKTTLLKLLAGISKQTKGTIETNKKVSSFIDLTGGFKKELNGRDNIILNCYLYGLRKKDILGVYKKILKFAGIPLSYIKSPLKSYSNGMLARLGFAIAINMHYDILLIDETLVVGDEIYQRKCACKIKSLVEAGKTIIMASHNLNRIRELCSEVYLLHHGHIIFKNSPATTIKYYLDNILTQNEFPMLSERNITALFSKGKLLLYWNELELTKNNACSTQIIPYTSSRMEDNWKVLTKTKDTLVMSCQYSLIPLVEIWTIKIENNIVYWDIVFCPEQDFDNIIINIDIMLYEGYDHWISQNKEGIFPEEFNKEHWSNIFISEENKGSIGIKGFKIFPQITFNDSSNSKFKKVIMNTDDYFQARVLRHTTKINILKNQKIAFNGVIHFSPA